MTKVKVKGTDVYLMVNTGVPGGEWVPTKIGGQKDAAFDRGAVDIDTTDKDSEGWEESESGTKNWGLSFNSFLIENDPGFQEVEDAWESGEIKEYRIITPGATYEGKARVTALNISAPRPDASNVAFTLKGTGPLVKT